MNYSRVEALAHFAMLGVTACCCQSIVVLALYLSRTSPLLSIQQLVMSLLTTPSLVVIELKGGILVLGSMHIKSTS